ncbi:MAG: rhodanese-like domain-containing protein [Candidatus Eutrophobiaceae bacterium]
MICLFVAVLSLVVWDFYSAAMRGTKSLGISEATLMLNRDEAMLIDLRPVAEFDDGHITCAHNIPTAELSQRLPKLSAKENGLILCCSNGTESHRQAKLLGSEGYAKLFILQGGMREWLQAGLPMARKRSKKKH